MTQQYTHPKRKTKVVFVQLGSPSEPTTKALRKYLRAFLGDPRVVDINPWLWKIILNLFVMIQQYTHPKRKTKVVFVQLGSPSEPTTKALRTVSYTHLTLPTT